MAIQWVWTVVKIEFINNFKIITNNNNINNKIKVSLYQDKANSIH